MRGFIDILSMVKLNEMRVGVWSGATITVLHNPNRLAFENFTKRHEVLRGLLSDDGNDIYLWNGAAAVHPNIMQELGLGNYNCIFWSRGHWRGPDLHDEASGRWKPAIERLTPTDMKKKKQETDDLLRQLLGDDPDGLLESRDSAIDLSWLKTDPKQVVRWVDGCTVDEISQAQKAILPLIENHSIEVWRSMVLTHSQISALDETSRLGRYWSYDPQYASPYGTNARGTTYRFQGRLNVRDVDWAATFEAHHNGEREICALDYKPIVLLGIEIIDDVMRNKRIEAAAVGKTLLTGPPV